jgi:hypothetical protein
MTSVLIQNNLGYSVSDALIRLTVTSGGVPRIVPYRSSITVTTDYVGLSFMFQNGVGNNPSKLAVADVSLKVSLKQSVDLWYSAPYSYLRMGSVEYSAPNTYTVQAYVNPALNTMLGMPPYGYSSGVPGLSGCFTDSVYSLVEKVPFQIGAGLNWLKASGANSLVTDPNTRDYFCLLTDGNSAQPHMILCLVSADGSTSPLYINGTNVSYGSSSPPDCTWGVYLNYNPSLTFADSVALFAYQSGQVYYISVSATSGALVATAKTDPGQYVSNPPNFANFPVSIAASAQFNLVLNTLGACIVRPALLNCWALTSYGCPNNQPVCTLQATNTGGQLCSTACSASTASELQLAKTFVGDVCAKSVTATDTYQCNTVAQIPSSSCTGWLSKPLARSCTQACQFIGANESVTPSFCDTTKKTFCAQDANKNLPDCACINVTTSSFATTALKDPISKTPLTYNDFVCYVSDHTADGRIDPKVTLFPECWWPACLPNSGGLTLDNVNCPTTWVGCLNLVQGIYQNPESWSSSTFKTECGTAETNQLPVCGGGPPPPPLPPSPVPPPQPKPSPGGGKSLSKTELTLIIVGAAVAVAILIVGLSVGLYFRKKRKNMQSSTMFK